MKIKKIGAILLNIIFYVVLAFFILVCLFMFKARLDNKQPVIFGYKFYVILTGSMSPNINPGDLIMDKEVKAEDISVDDVITFKNVNADGVTTHRVKDISNEEGNIAFTTKGDANNVQDISSVKAENLDGKVVKVFSGVGDKIQFLQRNMMKIFMALAVVVIITTIGFILKKPKKTS